MKRQVLIIFIALILMLTFTILLLPNKKIKQKQFSQGINVLPTMNDLVTNDSVWCGTFQLVWNDMKNEVVKQDIVFNPQITMANNLNKEDFNENMLSKDSYYKIYGIKSKELKEKIKNGEIDLTIKKDKQLQHIKNSEKYIVGKSYFNDKYSNIDKLQELVNEYAGKGRIIASKKGELVNKEIIRINENVGKYILKDNDEIIMNEDTNSFTIHYSKNGVHITPSRKRSDKK